jgi:hypothetical protein
MKNPRSLDSDDDFEDVSVSAQRVPLKRLFKEVGIGASRQSAAVNFLESFSRCQLFQGATGDVFVSAKDRETVKEILSGLQDVVSASEDSADEQDDEGDGLEDEDSDEG